MSYEALILHSLPIMLLGILIGRIAAERLISIKGSYQKASIGIVLGIFLAIINFFTMKKYTLCIDFLGYDPRLIVCHIISGGILLLALDLLINSRFSTRKR